MFAFAAFAFAFAFGAGDACAAGFAAGDACGAGAGAADPTIGATKSRASSTGQIRSILSRHTPAATFSVAAVIQRAPLARTPV